MKLLLVDDHKLLLSGLSALMSDWQGDYQTICCTDIDCACQHLLLDAEISMVVADMQMPANRGALDLLAWMQQQELQVPLLVLSALEYPEIAHRALQAGASGYIEKSAGHEALHTAIDRIAAGETYLPPHWPDLIDWQDQGITVADGEEVIRVAPRLLKILTLIREGQTNKQMAIRLELSENTVKSYIKEIYTLLNVNNRSECIYRSEQLGLFEF